MSEHRLNCRAVKVRIVQLLCPSRHCVMAGVYESPDGAEMPGVSAELKERFAASGLNPWCGLCGSRELTCEDRATGFASLDEAVPAMRKEEAKQLNAGDALRLLNEYLARRRSGLN